MREILFRVWDMVENCYLPEDVYCILNKTEFGAFGKMIKDWRDYREGEYFYDDSQILEQFTGLTDKNGVKIFEGDIINYTQHYFNTDIQNKKKKEVKYCEDRWNIFETNAGESNLEIIGNIYDNPELLKEL